MVIINGATLSISEVVSVARNLEEVHLCGMARDKVKEVRKWVEGIVEKEQPVYGINTGFGALSEKRISHKDIKKLNRNLILSHAVAVGEPLPKDVVRAALLVRANTLACGFSGVREEIIDVLIEMLNKDVIPVIPSQGSLGSSGDLAQLCTLALSFSVGENLQDGQRGVVEFAGKQMNSDRAFRLAGIRPLCLQAKEGLAFSNGATFSAALASLAVYDAENLLRTANLSLAMTLEALLGSSAAFDKRIHKARRHPGQLWVAEQVNHLVASSSLIDKGERVQDAYSLRCAPAVQGAAYDTLLFVKDVVTREINAATDNPLIFEPLVALSGGNFHGEPLGFAMDYLAIALSEVASISERRTFRLLDDKLNGGLPLMLVHSQESAGLNSGLMMAQYTAASLVLENRVLATPDSVSSLPTSAGQEDHNANSMTAARHAALVLINVRKVLSIELLVAAQALDIRLHQMPFNKPGVLITQAHSKIRELVPYMEFDNWLGPIIEELDQIVFAGDLLLDHSSL